VSTQSLTREFCDALPALTSLQTLTIFTDVEKKSSPAAEVKTALRSPAELVGRLADQKCGLQQLHLTRPTRKSSLTLSRA
jgi:hypothetical protein